MLELPGALPDMQHSYTAALADTLAHSTHSAAFKAEAVARIRSELKLAAMIKDAEFKMSSSSLTLLPEYGHKLKVLQQLQFVSEDEVRRGTHADHALHKFSWRHLTAELEWVCCLGASNSVLASPAFATSAPTQMLSRDQRAHRGQGRALSSPAMRSDER